MLWIKECLINDGIKSAVQLFGDSCQYISWVDGDVSFRDPQWALETLHELQHYAILQPWSICYDLGPKGEHVELHHSFCEVYLDGRSIVQGPRHNGKAYRFAHPGYAWAARRPALAFCGGLIDTAILGAADHHMALALIDKVADTYPNAVTAGYKAPLQRWQSRALTHSGFGRNVGIVRGTIEHLWHGPKRARGYIPRWTILERNLFDPATDLVRNEWGIWELAGNKPQLRRDIDRYFRQRDEDSNTLGEDGLPKTPIIDERFVTATLSSAH
jgi:hypothetical protein